MSATIAPEQILKELAELWVDTGKQGQAESGSGVLRACTMTLLVLAEAAEDTQALGETIAALMPEHPARTIVVRLTGEGERALAERVYSQCWMPFGQRRQICCEQVEITISDAALADLRSVVVPLTVPDLPLIIWCRSARFPQMKNFWAIASLATKLIMDTAADSDRVGALMCAAATAGSGIVFGDLAWARLTRWREMLSQLFENQQNVTQVSRIAKVEVEWGGSRQVPALYLGAWLRDALLSASVRPALQFSQVSAEDFLRVVLKGDGFHAELVRNGDRMEVTLNGTSHCTNLPQPTDYLLMREELGIVRHDPVFEKTLASAAQLAYPTDR